MTRAWLLPLGAAIMAPLVTWLPMLAHKYPGLGLPRYDPAQGIDFWQQQVFYCALIVMVAAIAGRHDRWLGIALSMAGLLVLYRGAYLNPQHTVMFAAGVLMLTAIRHIPSRYHRTVVTALVSLGVFEALYAIQQAWFNYDVLWGPLFNAKLREQVLPLGTLGTVDALGSYLAIVAPLAPFYLLPLLVAAVLSTHSIGAYAALWIGVWMRYRSTWFGWLWLVAAGGATMWLFVWKFARAGTESTVYFRAVMQDFGVRYWLNTNPVLGLGLGGWKDQIPAQQVKTNFAPSKELWAEAHNEPIQWVVELGLVGAVLLAGWLWTHRAMFAHPVYGASITALLASCQSFFPFHMIATALLGLLVIGLATPIQEPATAASS